MLRPTNNALFNPNANKNKPENNNNANQVV